jgi:hypothetical protein
MEKVPSKDGTSISFQVSCCGAGTWHQRHSSPLVACLASTRETFPGGSRQPARPERERRRGQQHIAIDTAAALFAREVLAFLSEPG